MITQLLRKKDLTLCISNFKKILKYYPSICIYGTCMHPLIDSNSSVITCNGVTIVKSFLPFHVPISVVTTPGISDVLAVVENAAKGNDVYMSVDDERGISFIINNEKHYITDVRKTAEPVTSIFQQMSDYNEVYATCSRDKPITPLSNTQLETLKLSKLLEINTGTLGVVRLSRNMIPFTGPIRKSSDTPFSGSYSVREILDVEGNPIDYVIILFINYKSMEAIHMYSFVPFA